MNHSREVANNTVHSVLLFGKSIYYFLFVMLLIGTGCSMTLDIESSQPLNSKKSTNKLVLTLNGGQNLVVVREGQTATLSFTTDSPVSETTPFHLKINSPDTVARNYFSNLVWNSQIAKNTVMAEIPISPAYSPVQTGDKTYQIEVSSDSLEQPLVFSLRILDLESLPASYNPPTVPTSLNRVNPSALYGTASVITIEAAGVIADQTLLVYLDSLCLNSFASTAIISNPQSVTLSGFSSDQLQTFYARTENAEGERSICSTASVNYYQDTIDPTPPLAVTLGAIPNSLSLSPVLNFADGTDAGSGFDHVEVKLLKTVDDTITQDWTTLVSGQSFSALSLQAGQSYYFRLRSVDQAGRTSAEVMSSNYSANFSPFTANITSTTNASTNLSPIPITVTFNQTTINFAPSDLQISNATLSNWSGSGANYAFELTPSGQGTLSVQLPAATVTDLWNNPNGASNTLSRLYDTDAPSVTWSNFATNPIVNLANQSAFLMMGTCSYDGGNVVITGSFSANTTCNNGTWTYNADLSSLSEGNLTASISQTDEAGNQGSSVYNFTKDTIPPAIPTFILSDVDSGSAQITDAANVTLVIAGDTDAVQWCLKEQASINPPPSAPNLNDSCWTTIRPTSAVLGALGDRRVYLRTRDQSQNISAAWASHSINYNNLGAFTIKGIRGGTDVSLDHWLLGDSNVPVIEWENSNNAVTFDVAVYDMSLNQVVCSLVSENSPTLVHTFTGCNLDPDKTYKARVWSKDNGSGIREATNSPFIFTRTTMPTYSLWDNSNTPTLTGANDSGSVELGMSFKSNQNGFIKGIRFYKDVQNTGTHIGNLWTSTGTLLATATFTNESASGWQEVRFASPVAVTTGTRYVASYFAPQGHYAMDISYFTNYSRTLGPLYAYSDSGGSPNGLFFYGPTGGFPVNSYSGTNYWVDVIWEKSSTSTPALDFKITGLSGGADTFVDLNLLDAATPTLHWKDAIGEVSYQATLFEDNGTTIKCNTLTAGADVTTITFSNCPLSLNTFYRAQVVAIDPDGTPFPAENNSVRFYTGLGVQPVYPVWGRNWMDYVRNDGPGKYKALDLPCNGTEVGYDLCLHGAEIQRVSTIQPNCNGISATDSLGVFKWICLVENGNAIFYTDGFQAGKGLRDLLNPTSFKSLSVTVTGSLNASTLSDVWWTNNVQAAPANGQPTDTMLALESTGTIFTVAASTTTSGYSIGEKTSLVTLAGVTLTQSNQNTTNCNGGDQCLILAFPYKQFIWLEVNLEANSGFGTFSDYGIFLYDVRFIRVHNSSIKNTNNIGLRLNGSYSSYFSDIRLNHGGYNFALNADALTRYNLFENITIDYADYGVQLYGSHHNTLRNIKINSGGHQGFTISGHHNNIYNLAVTNGQFGILLENGATENLFSDLTVSNTHYSAILVADSTKNSFVNGLLMGGELEGLNIGTSQENLFSGFTIANFIGDAVQIADNAHRNTFHQFVLLNNDKGLEFEDTTQHQYNTFDQLVAANNNSYGIYLTNLSHTTKFTGNLLVGSNGLKNCQQTGGTNAGLTDTTCTLTGSEGSVGYDSGFTSNARLGINRSLASSFVAKITNQDLTNTSNNNLGQASFTTPAYLLDWWQFETPFRVWGLIGSTFPNFDQAGRWTSGSGQIWDWRLLATDTVLLNKSGDGTQTNEAFVANTPCPAEVAGTLSLQDQQTVPMTYLKNAIEIVDPKDQAYSATGNHNGLCENNESCLYTPNFGRYQGEGSKVTCTFANGSITNVSIWGFTTNGKN